MLSWNFPDERPMPISKTPPSFLNFG